MTLPLPDQTAIRTTFITISDTDQSPVQQQRRRVNTIIGAPIGPVPGVVRNLLSEFNAVAPVIINTAA